MSTATVNSKATTAIPQRKPYMSSTRLGMWWFLASEVGTFGGVVVSFLMMRYAHPEWAREAGHTNQMIGIINTIVLLTSSYTMVQAHHAAEHLNTAKAKKLVLATMGMGLLFLCFKAVEYTLEIREGNYPNGTSAKLFWSFYFGMTGLHCLHIIAGLLMMLFLVLFMHRPYVLKRVAPIGLYWHFVDIVWILLFPLLYVASHTGH